MPIKDAEDQLIKIFHGTGTQLMEDASHFDPIVGVRITPILGRNLQAIRVLTGRVQFRRVVMAITQDEADLGGHFTQQVRCWVTLSDSGGSQHGSDGKPDRCDDRDDVQLPAIDESTASPIWSSGLPYQWRCGGFPPALGVFDARRRHESATLCYRWPPLAHRWPTVG